MADKEQELEEVLEGEYDPEAEVVGNWKKVDLPVIEVKTDEQTHQLIDKFPVRLYRWKGEWKQRGIGTLKFLREPESRRVRLIVREDKILRIRANHLLKSTGPFCQLKKMETHENSWTWMAMDFSDQSNGAPQRFSVRLATASAFDQFKTVFQNCCKENETLSVTKE